MLIYQQQTNISHKMRGKTVVTAGRWRLCR